MLWIRFPVWRELKLYPCYVFPISYQITFGSAFPFEGNWNYSWLNACCMLLPFGSAFPFEGNWNWPSSTASTKAVIALWIRVPVWRELKQIAFRDTDTINPSSLDPLSRLKGIETCSQMSYVWLLYQHFGSAFPFEGNWNAFNFLELALRGYDLSSLRENTEATAEIVKIS